MLKAITRDVSPAIDRCELTFHTREPIDIERASRQHEAYKDCLRELGLDVMSLPAELDLPDSMFVEDTAVVTDEIAVITRPGAISRQPETATIAEALTAYRPLRFITEPATLEGGDVMRIGKVLFVGRTARTNEAGIAQLQEFMRPHDYDVQAVDVTNCLHLKSGCSYIGRDTILVNRSCVDASAFRQLHLLDVPANESAAANALLVGDTVILPAGFPETRALLERRGFSVRVVDVSELQKAEAGVTCCSLIFR